MKNCITPLNITRSLFLLVAIASMVSMAINTWSFDVFLRYFSISTNMVITMGMLYLVFFLTEIKEVKKKNFAMTILGGILVYLLVWNGLPFLIWISQIGLSWAVEKSGMSTLMFMGLSSLQIVIVPVLLFLLLRLELNSVFQKTPYKPMVHLGILWAVFLGVLYLIIAAM